jgi:hypothetical protein
MRKFLLILIAGLLSLTLAAPAQAVVKSGSKCTKMNATSTVSGKKYACIKSGGKLVWSKGVVVKQVENLNAGVCPQINTADKSSGISVARANTLIGMQENESESCAAQLAWGYRVSSRDGKVNVLTLDYRMDRVNVSIKEGLIFRVDIG